MKLPVLPGPCMPQPTTPMVIRFEGDGRPSAPKALAGMKVGAANAKPVAARKRRRLMPEFSEGVFIDALGLRGRPPDFEKKDVNRLRVGSDLPWVRELFRPPTWPRS